MTPEAAQIEPGQIEPGQIEPGQIEPGQVELHVLGPTLVTVGGRELPAGRPMERALLVRLALARGTPVADDRLAADLWGDAAPAAPAPRLRTLVSRIRAALGDELLHRTAAGYAATARPADLLAAEAAAGSITATAAPGAVRDAATAALAHWRGPALIDVRHVPWGRAEGERLDRWRVDLAVHRYRAESALDATAGGATRILQELAALSTANPWHEPLQRLQAELLYRAGRSAEALGHIGRLRRTLAAELGVTPATETAELELRLLRHDPALRHDPLRRTEAPARARSASMFVGRDADMAALLERLAAPGLVTLVGVAGSGKSRLALEAVGRSARPAVLVELAPLRREDAVVPAVATAAGVDTGAGDPLPAIAAALETSLLVLDNAEHVVETVSAVTHALRRAAPGIRVLVTSQRPLRLDGEARHDVGPLAPDAAGALFRERTAADAATDDADVARICAAVDHLPLGIELAAGLTRTLSVRQLADRVDDRLRLLVAHRHSAAAGAGRRHASLRAALDWSYELLAERSRAVLRRLGVFAGGFDLDAAERVAASADIEVGDVAPAIADLVDRSLVGVGPARMDPRRLFLLDTVRSYALDRLHAAGEPEPVRDRHLSWCLDHTRARGTDTAGSADAVAALLAEWPNLLAALEHAPGGPRAADGLRLATALHQAWASRGWFAEARRHFTALTGADGVSPTERVQALSFHGFHALMAGHLDEAASRLEVADTMVGEPATAADGHLTSLVRYYRGIVEAERGRPRSAIVVLRSGERFALQAGLDRRASAFADAIGTAHLFAGDVDGSLRWYRIAVERAGGDEHRLSVTLSNTAQSLVDGGRVAESLQVADESDGYAQRLDDQLSLACNELTRAHAAIARGDPDAAGRFCRSALTFTGVRRSRAHLDLASALLAGGDLDGAAAALDVVRELEPSEGTNRFGADALSAVLALARGDRAGARQLLDAVEARFGELGFGWPRYTVPLAAVRAALHGPAETG
ncbi:BTAD domain-containing putative transcriptional regulator [Pseudonocardia sp. TRM90224]|uniref:BTAD domain-containing putative transcriptional regulator n=1 Tax=Pseudonocardia sp. TRM90224 TaxID=2812678 RepID=UPI001E41E501|nr:BTAD domain-containing putative transcriptional regulator [Pseudonocardia sp. TRM90224]